MPDQDNYILKRDYWASLRLNTQHSYWVNTFEYLLHPSIPLASNDSQGLSVIDVGTGTGIMLLGLDQHLKAPVKELVGADISDSQFPHHSTLPARVKLITLDALDPNGPPEELRGRFDIVSARYLCGLVQDGRPNHLIDFFSKLVKPGGYLQWSEPYHLDAEVISTGGSTEGLDFMKSSIEGMLDWAWLDLTDKEMRPYGFDIVALDRRHIHPWQRRWETEIRCVLLEELAPRFGWPIDKVKEMNQKAIAESVQGSYIKSSVQNVIARKKGPD